jgi:hypothetical protein
MPLLCCGWKEPLERTDEPNIPSVGQIEGRKGRVWRNACIACSFTAGTPRAGLGEERGTVGNQVILQSTAYIMPERRAARIHPFLPIHAGSRRYRTVPSQLCRGQLIWSMRCQTINLTSPSLFAFSRSVQQNGHFTPVTKGYPRFDVCFFCR